MSKQTAVEFLVKKINELTGLTIAIDEPCIEEANEMFKQQIIDAFKEDTFYYMDAQDYYNQTFNK